MLTDRQLQDFATLLEDALDDIRKHGSDYHHRTSPKLVARLQAAILAIHSHVRASVGS